MRAGREVRKGSGKGNKSRGMVRGNRTKRVGRARRERWGRIGESKCNRWYKMVKGTGIPGYLRKGWWRVDEGGLGW